jgi:hypothetical protein
MNKQTFAHSSGSLVFGAETSEKSPDKVGAMPLGMDFITELFTGHHQSQSRVDSDLAMFFSIFVASAVTMHRGLLFVKE